MAKKGTTIELVNEESLRNIRNPNNIKIRSLNEEKGEEEEIDNKLQLLKSLAKVEGAIKQDFGYDFTLMKADEKDKEGIIEVGANAYFQKRIGEHIIGKARKWEWIKQENGEYMWVKRKLNKLETNKVNNAVNGTFNLMMKRLQITSVMNRNREGNFLVNKLSQYMEDEDARNKEEAQQNSEIMAKAKKIMASEN